MRSEPRDILSHQTSSQGSFVYGSDLDTVVHREKRLVTPELPQDTLGIASAGAHTGFVHEYSAARDLIKGRSDVEQIQNLTAGSTPQSRRDRWREAANKVTGHTRSRQQLVGELVASLGHISIEPEYALDAEEISSIFNEASELNINDIELLPRIRTQIARLMSIDEQEVFCARFSEHLKFANAEIKPKAVNALNDSVLSLPETSEIGGTSPILMSLLELNLNEYKIRCKSLYARCMQKAQPAREPDQSRASLLGMVPPRSEQILKFPTDFS